MKISLVTPLPWTAGTTHAQVYREAVEQVSYAEELGFDCVWFTEHHFATHGINPSVFSFLGYVAGITTWIRLGTAVAVVPLYHPLRLAEDVATVDFVSNGRLELGIGSGYRHDEFTGFRVAQEDSRAMLPKGSRFCCAPGPGSRSPITGDITPSRREPSCARCRCSNREEHGAVCALPDAGSERVGSNGVVRCPSLPLCMPSLHAPDFL